MDSNNTAFDNALFSILKECKTLPNFLDVVFGFLKRRTDFYYIAPEANSPVGLPQGWAERFVKEAFFKWKPPDESIDSIENIPEAIEEIVISSDDVIDILEEPVSDPAITENDDLHSNVVELSNKTFTPSESYNGAVFENYTWSQTITDIDIIVKLPENTTSKHLFVTILSNKIIVKLKNSGTVLLDGELCQKVKHNEAIWSLDKEKLEIHLDKLLEMWWDCLVKNEPKLDVSKIDCSRPFEELSEEAQAKIEELTWNEERKRLGLPTSDQIVLQQKLKKGWDAEGCPFDGPFDPNTVIIH